MSEIKARAEIIFYEDKFEKPMVMLTGRWSAREVNKVEGLVIKQYRQYIRSIQKGELKLEDAPIEVVEEKEEAAEPTEGDEEEASNG